VQIVEVPQPPDEPDGSVASKQAAEVILPRSELERLWTPEYLERLARTYWRFLERVSLGLLRVRYTEDARLITLIAKPFVLLRFQKPQYELNGDSGTVTWRIARGLLVAPAGRGRGYLRISVLKSGDDRVWISSEVASFYPAIAGSGWFARIGRPIYRFTQLRIHVIVTHAFLRSLALLDLVPSRVGALAASPGSPRSLPAASRDRVER